MSHNRLKGTTIPECNRSRSVPTISDGTLAARESRCNPVAVRHHDARTAAGLSGSMGEAKRGHTFRGKLARWALALCVVLLVVSSAVWGEGSDPWNFGVFCDTRGNNEDTPGKSCVNQEALAAIAGKIVEAKCELVLVPGDLVNGFWANGGMGYGDQFAIWKEIMAPVYKANIQVYSVRGNHEDGTISPYPPVPPYNTKPDPDLLAAYLSEFGITNPQNGPNGEKGLTYSFKHKNALFIGLDEYISPHRVNQTWLDEQLGSSTSQHVFVYGHEPAYQVVHPDCLAAYSRERQLFWDSLGAAGCRIYFCGHDHLYDRAHVPDLRGNVVWQVLLGSGGAPPGHPWAPPHVDGSVTGDDHVEGGVGFAIVTVGESSAQINWWWWNSDYVPEPEWTVLDSFEYVLPAPAHSP